MKFDDEPSSSEEDDEPPLPPLAPQTKGLTKSPSQKNESEARGLASLNMNNFYFPGKKTFDDWTKFQLVTALVRDGQTIRDENYMSLGTVKSFAEAVFMDRPPPPKPKPYTLEEQTKRHHAALTIQNAYFTWMITALQNEGGATGEGNVAHMHDDILAAMHSNDTLAGERPHIPSESSFKRKAAVEQDPHQVNSQRELDLDSGLREDLEMMNDPTDDNSTAQNSILEEEFIPPSLEYAQLYADYNHPRLGGLGGKVMPWLRTSTGRHCHAGGWGEQCDLFEERQVLIQ